MPSPYRLAVTTVASLVVSSLTGCGSESGPLPPATAAHVVEVTRLGVRSLELQIESPALGETVGVRLLLPPEWSPRAHRRWPVLYVLHGAEAFPNSHPPNYTTWMRSTDIEDLTANRDVLVVMPEGGDVGWYSDWYNDGAGGPPGWETFHLVELREILEQEFRANDRRAIAGLSMGGFGAASYAARHPGMFQAVATFSAPLTINAGLARTIVTTSLALQGFDRDALWGNPITHPEIWEAHDPIALAENLVGTPVFVSAGNGTPGPLDGPGATTDGLEAATLQSSQEFVARLRSVGGDVTTDFYGSGTHAWPYWEQELHRALPLLLGAIGAD